MKKKNLLSVFLILLAVSFNTVVFAQNLGADYFNTGELKIAKDYFEKHMSQSPAESNYYLGEIAYANGDVTGAKAYYEKGLAASPEYVLNNIGLGKVLLKEGNAKAADEQFSIAIKKDKKDVEVQVAIARAYYLNGMKDKVQAKLQDARKADKKSPLIYLFEGDMLRDAKDAGGAAGQYAQAFNFDPNCVVAYIKTAQVYESINPNSAIDNLTKALEIRPDYKLAYKSLGTIYYKSGQYNKAIDAFKEFFKDGVYSTEELTHYAAALYFTKQYEEAKALIEEGIKKEPNNFVLNRLLMYSYLDSKDYEKGLSVAEKFFSLDKGTSEYISRDHLTYGQLLTENKMFDKAISQYELALKLDPSQTDIYKLVGETLSNEGRPAEAADYFKKYIELAGESAVALDYFNMGRYYYMAAGVAMKDTIDPQAGAKAKQYLSDADAAFTTVGERVPDSHLGQFWRARANALMDAILAKESQALPVLAKPYYEATINIILAKEGTNNVNELKEAYRYLSSSYYLAFDASKKPEDKDQTLLYSQKLLELDPENVQAKQLIEALK